MKTYKIISVFFITIILASCSKDDEASKSFFNKYDGIAWEFEGDNDNGLIFNKSPKSASFFIMT